MIEKLENYRIVDLTKTIIPSQMGRRCEIRINHSDRTDDYNCDIDIMSHLGTHVEAPRHWNLDWKDVSDLPASSFMGRCVMQKIDDIEPAGKITAAHMDKADCCFQSGLRILGEKRPKPGGERAKLITITRA